MILLKLGTTMMELQPEIVMQAKPNRICGLLYRAPEWLNPGEALR